ncbi:hypothetical protein [Paraburkholderia phytofirmans]|uniref:hypothetical protein n=1 Tax=Paraburkholderia phytofirmans TaxID=261302 RepID=UPI0038BD1A51
MFGESFRYATASFRGSTQHFTDPGESCAKTRVCPRIEQREARANDAELTREKDTEASTFVDLSVSRESLIFAPENDLTHGIFNNCPHFPTHCQMRPTPLSDH